VPVTFADIKGDCEKYVKEYWFTKRKTAQIVPQSAYFRKLATRITNMSKYQLDHFAAMNIGFLYNMLLPKKVS